MNSNSVSGESPRNGYEFGPYRVDPAERLFHCNHREMALTPKAFDTLLLLLEHSGHLIEKDQFMQRLWPDSVVEEVNLAHHISQLRKVFEENTPGEQFIQTVPTRGYRFVAPVTRVPSQGMRASASPVMTPSGTRGGVPKMPVRGRTRGRRAPVAMALGAAALLAYFWADFQSGRQPAMAESRSIAVLPFKWVSPAGADEYLGMGLADALVSRLSNVRTLTVRSTSQVTRLGDAVDPVSAGRILRVETVLDGTMRREGERLRLTVQLVNVRDGAAVWSASFDEEFSNLFELEDAIAGRVAGSLVAQLTRDESDLLAKRGTESIEAYQAFRKGRYFWNRFTEEGGRRSIEYYLQAIEIDPRYAAAYAAMADSYIALGLFVLPALEAFPQAKDYAEQALKLDGRLAEAHAALGSVKFYYEWDWEGAERHIRAAAEINPGYVEAYPCFMHFQAAMGQSEEAIVFIQRALRSDPDSVWLNAELGCAKYYAGQYGEAIAQCQAALELDPHYLITLYNLGRACAQIGRYSEALEALEAARTVDSAPVLLAEAGYVHARAGRRGEAEKLLDELKSLRRQRQRYVDPYPIAWILCALGDHEGALEWLETALEERSPWLPFLKAEPKFDPLRSNQRFQELLRQVG
jgi:tetratricopeptide (TPR) repeat protein/DNA-binding winged helix-turn-helix (wHTH) protein